ncbi:MAG: DUF1343 domain-containing protein [Limnochordia bacterium]|nr:DUF1343 domain-containing protein [Limnochordia bacterium]
MTLRFSIDHFCANLPKYAGTSRLGLITNPSGVDSKLTSTIDRLHETGRLVALYGPEHGVRGHFQAGEKVQTYDDPQTGLPVFSLYGDVRKPTREMLVGVDALVIDLQDVGCRFYTYLYTLLYALEAAREFDLPIFVLDRPNPLGGEIVEGNLLEKEYTSFVGYPIPIRYGLTIGEMALYFNTIFEIKAELTVVPLEGWSRADYQIERKMTWVPTSPNVPKVDTVFVYPGTCLVEGTNLSEGRGTALPFETVGAPFINGDRLAGVLNALDLPGVRFRPTSFKPTFSKHAGEQCQGVQIHVSDRVTYKPVQTGVRLIETVAKLYDQFEFLKPPAGARHYFFDLLAGSDQMRKLIDANQPLDEMFFQWEIQQKEFRAQSERFMLYKS